LPEIPGSVLAFSTFFELARASDLLSVRLGNCCDNQKLTYSQLGILEALLKAGPLCQKDLGEKILKSSGNVTLVIDNLEKRKLVQRERKGDDRRVVTIHLTEDGKRTILEVLPRLALFFQEEMKAITSEEQNMLSRICKKLTEARKTG